MSGSFFKSARVHHSRNWNGGLHVYLLRLAIANFETRTIVLKPNLSFREPDLRFQSKHRVLRNGDWALKSTSWVCKRKSGIAQYKIARWRG